MTAPVRLVVMNLGSKIRTLRLERGWTMPQLAERAGVSKGFLFQIESDVETNPSLDTLDKIAKALGITLAVLLEEESAQAKQTTPEKLEAALEEFIKERHASGRTVDTDILRSLYSLQHRKGSAARKTKDDWAFLYESIERVHKRK